MGVFKKSLKRALQVLLVGVVGWVKPRIASDLSLFSRITTDYLLYWFVIEYYQIFRHNQSMVITIVSCLGFWLWIVCVVITPDFESKNKQLTTQLNSTHLMD